jgi:hypothetical protein
MTNKHLLLNQSFPFRLALVTTQLLESRLGVTSFLIIVFPYLRISLSTGSISVFPVQENKLAGTLDRIFLNAASVSVMLR